LFIDRSVSEQYFAGVEAVFRGMENADEQGNQAATRPEGSEVADPAEPREGPRKSRPLGE
jgi:hypothetical protein